MYNPDLKEVSCPGDTISDILIEKDLTIYEFSVKMELPMKTCFGLLRGETKITRELAVKLKNVLGSTDIFWLNRENLYRLGLSKRLSKEL